jgi:hypothetical protein
MSSRPYQRYSEAELLDLRRNFDNQTKAVDREKSDYQRRVGGSFWNNEGYKEIEEKSGRIWEALMAVDAELAGRRAERASAPKPPAGWYADPQGQGACRWWD